jgi:16S rRNA (cytosine1402-N4)-methyltransferase
MGDIYPHQPVLYQEIIQALRPTRDQFYVDCTLGAGGHAYGILEASSPSGKLMGFEVDPQALELAQRRLSGFGGRVFFRRSSYIFLLDQLKASGWQTVNGIIMDFGVSSMQLDTPGKGFSFMADAPLDMRFDPDNPQTAADLVNRLPEKELADLIFRLGEERYSRQVARVIVQSRPIFTTRALSEVITNAIGKYYRSSPIHPATRTFQALRIAVNQELDAIQSVLPQAVQALAPGGRLAVISFHSLEDRLVKEFFRRESKDCLCPPRQPTCTCGHIASIVEISRKPIQSSEAEILNNPRSRSARLRIAEKK